MSTFDGSADARSVGTFAPTLRSGARGLGRPGDDAHDLQRTADRRAPSFLEHRHGQAPPGCCPSRVGRWCSVIPRRCTATICRRISRPTPAARTWSPRCTSRPAGTRSDPIGETAWLADLARAHGLPTVLVVYAPLDDPRAGEILEAQCACPLVRGVRFILSWHDDPNKSFVPRSDYMRDRQWLEGFALLAALRPVLRSDALPRADGGGGPACGTLSGDV